MAGRSACAELLSGLRTLTHVGVTGNLSDAQLLDRFLARSGETAELAFEALVARHGPMVLDVCGNVLRDPHNTQDAFQATFLVLASRAGSIRRRDALASWLLGVARRVALRSRADVARRRVYEGRAAEANAYHSPEPPESWSELHEEIDRLPERYREPVVLCYLEGLSTQTAAVRLGCPHGTILSRLSRARERLRGGLTRRGLAPTGLLTAGIAPGAAPTAIPPKLLTATVRASLIFTEQETTAAGLVSTTAVALAKGVVHTMMISKLKTLAAAMLACVLTLGGIQTFARHSAAPVKPRERSSEPAAEMRTITVHVVDADGKPMAGAHVFRNHVYKPDGTNQVKIENMDYSTTADGKAVINLSGTSVDLRLWAKKSGFVPLHAMWATQFQSDGDQIPMEFTFQMGRGTEIGGVVVSEQGAPIEGVKVEVRDRTADSFHLVRIEKRLGQRPVRSNSLAEGAEAIVTDARGRWKLDNVPPDEELIAVPPGPADRRLEPPKPPLEIELHLSHPDYISDDMGWGDLQHRQGITLRSLRDQSAKIVLIRKAQPEDAAGVAAEPTPKTPATSNGKLWATITVRWPIERQGEATKRISVYFALVNDGDKPVVPKTKIKSSKLLINGKVYENWPNIVSDVDAPGGSRRLKRFDSLRPEEGLLFGYIFEDAFSKPGIYRVQWEGEGFRSPEIMFRVMPERQDNDR
jgi:RNA polymerase sigma factor (sigma-70 family)